MAVGPSERCFVWPAPTQMHQESSHPLPWACLPEMQRRIASLWGRKAKLPRRSGRTGWSELFKLFSFLSKILSSERFTFSTWWLWNEKPVLLSCQELRHGVSLQYTPSGGLLQAALEVVMKNTDIFNIKLFLFWFCCYSSDWDLQSIWEMYMYTHTHILKERKRSLDSFRCGILFSDLNGKFTQSLDPSVVTPATVLWLFLL